ncbi:MAG TPA: S8 family serine peptidase [Nitrososphaeraceae archaeon]
MKEQSDGIGGHTSQHRGKKIVKGIWKGQEIHYLDGEIIIRYKPDVVKQLNDPRKREHVKNGLLQQLPHGFKVAKDINRFGILIIEVTVSDDIFSLIEQVERNPSVEYAEPNLIHHEALKIPNEYSDLAQLKSNQWGLERIRAPFGWDQTVGNSNVLISIIDSGIAMPERLPGAIYRWYSPILNDHFYTTDPPGEVAPASGYIYEGGPFRLFSSAIANTTKFFRWHHPTLNDHFYTTDPSGENAPAAGYLSEGDIGNIATTAISGTVELHRWYHPTLSDHFYTTDPSGENAPAAGYTYEGVSGFVNGTPVKILSHPDLSNENRIMIGNNKIDGSNFPIDDNGHGTHVCGIASADTNNTKGIAGVTWNCAVYAIKIFDMFGNATDSNFHDAVIEAVDFAKSRKKRLVINYSGENTTLSKTMWYAVKYALDRNAIIVAATGNDSNRSGPNPFIAPVGWPAAFSTLFNNVIAVGSIDLSNKISNFSNGGPEVTVVAPGESIQSTLPNYITPLNPGGILFGQLSGTSMATPQAAGLAALILSINQGLSPLRVRQIIEQTADDLGPAGRDNDFGHGRINCERALAMLMPHVIFRWYHPTLSDHFYTTDPSGENAPAAGYTYEGVSGFVTLT